MAYIINSFKKTKKSNELQNVNQDDKIFVFIVIFTAIIISIDYALVIKFINIIKNL